MSTNNGPTHAQTFRIPAEEWRQLLEYAEHDLRSVNSELIWILREHFRPKPVRRVSTGKSESNGHLE
jgi:hypothetical protein